MPSDNRPLTQRERVFAGAVAATGDALYAAEKAGYPSPRKRAHEALQRPAVCAEIQAQQMARLHNEAVPLAYDLLISQLQDENLAPQHRQGAAKIVLNAAKAYTDPTSGKSIGDMTPLELRAAIARVDALIGKDEAETLEPIEAPKTGVFD